MHNHFVACSSEIVIQVVGLLIVLTEVLRLKLVLIVVHVSCTIISVPLAGMHAPLLVVSIGLLGPYYLNVSWDQAFNHLVRR